MCRQQKFFCYRPRKADSFFLPGVDLGGSLFPMIFAKGNFVVICPPVCRSPLDPPSRFPSQPFNSCIVLDSFFRRIAFIAPIFASSYTRIGWSRASPPPLLKKEWFPCPTSAAIKIPTRNIRQIFLPPFQYTAERTFRVKIPPFPMGTQSC